MITLDAYTLYITNELLQYVDKEEVKKITNFYNDAITDGYLLKRSASEIIKEIKLLEDLCEF